MKNILLSILILISSFNIFAQINYFGLPAPPLAMIAFGDTVIAGYDNEVYISTNAGLRWNSNKLNINSTNNNYLKKIGNLVFYGGDGMGLHKYDTKTGIWSVVVGLPNTQITYFKNNYYYCIDSSILISKNTTGTWETRIKTNFNGNISNFFSDEQYLYILYEDGSLTTLYRTPNGESPKEIFSSPSISKACIYKGVLFISNSSGLYSSNNKGGNWTLNDSNLKNMELTPTDDYLFASNNLTGCFRLKDLSYKWDELSKDFPIGNINRIAYDKGVYYFNSLFSLYKSSDLKSYSPINSGINRAVPTHIFSRNNRRYAIGDFGYFVCDSLNDNWKQIKGSYKSICFLNDKLYLINSSNKIEIADKDLNILPNQIKLKDSSIKFLKIRAADNFLIASSDLGDLYYLNRNSDSIIKAIYPVKSIADFKLSFVNDTLYLAISVSNNDIKNVLFSINSGATWSAYKSLPNSVNYIAKYNDVIYVTSRNGLYKKSTSDTNFILLNKDITGKITPTGNLIYFTSYDDIDGVFPYSKLYSYDINSNYFLTVFNEANCDISNRTLYIATKKTGIGYFDLDNNNYKPSIIFPGKQIDCYNSNKKLWSNTFVHFECEPLPFCQQYYFELSTENEIKQFTSTNTFLYNFDLAPNSSYKLRVKGLGQFFESQWSDYIYIQTCDFYNPDTLELVYPPNGSLLSPQKLNLSWKNAGNCFYIIEYSTEFDLSKAFVNYWFIDTSITISNLIPNTTYYWRVSPFISNHLGMSSVIWKFTTNTTGEINEILKNDDIIVYPNPAVNQINLKYNRNDAENLTICIFDALGNTIRKLNDKSDNNIDSIDLSNLSPGSFTIVVRIGERTIVKYFTIVK